MEAAADGLRPDITLASAVRWIRRRRTPVRVTLITVVTLCPAAFVGDARLAAVRTALATASTLVALRRRRNAQNDPWPPSVKREKPSVDQRE